MTASGKPAPSSPPIGSIALEEARARDALAMQRDLLGTAAAILSAVRSIERLLLQLLPPAGQQLTQTRAEGEARELR